MSPQDWLKNNLDKLGSSFEEMFFRNVLSRITFDFGSLIAQFKFKDSDGKTRYCDFVYQEGSAIRIAIEVDGYDKRGTGTGMSKSDFVDWQRRQAALTSQGWFVLRFANTDVRDAPERCKQHIDLLLRSERQKSNYQTHIENSIRDLKNQLSQTQAQAQRSKASEEDHQRLIKQIDTLQHQLQLAQQEKPLTEDEETLLQRLNESQKQLQEISRENNIMKTTIWALTTLVAVTILALVFKPNTNETIKTVASVSDRPAQPEKQLTEYIAQPVLTPASTEMTSADNVQQSEPKIESSWKKDTFDQGGLVLVGNIQHRLPEKRPGSSCQNPLSWEQAASKIGKNAAIKGNIINITYRNDVRGKPTWIEVGGSRSKEKSITLIIWGNNRLTFESTLAELEKYDVVCAEGLVNDYKGKPQIKLSSLDQLYIYDNELDYHWEKHQSE